ncbi:hypothetical protein [Nonomuraea sp. NPDC050783]|uniref:hypothetical protein n=1 Tax=Nonomuraea sp. NPDC050783 TaxID=3154634 RepID=UPI003466BACA
MRQLGKVKIRGPLPEIRLDHWQLFLNLGCDLRGYQTVGDPQALGIVTWQVPGQLALFHARRDFTRFTRKTHANPGNPMVVRARASARAIAEQCGWSHYLLKEVDSALLVLFSGHAPGDRLSYSEIRQVDKLGLNVSHTAEVVDELGLLDDDRPDTFSD